MSNFRETIQQAINDIISKSNDAYDLIGLKLNQLNSKISSLINDNETSGDKTWSSTKINNLLGDKADDNSISTVGKTGRHSDLNLDDGTNPHGTTRSDIGLSNVLDVEQYPVSNPANFETPEKLDSRDTANKDRANHTGTQPASTISDFDKEVADNDKVKANTSHRNSTNNPHNVTQNQLGLGNVDNTSDEDKPISTDTQNALDNKVNKVAGKGLSDENFTSSEKSKLEGLESSKFKGEYTSLSSLENSVSNPGTGDYANVDGGENQRVVRYIYDNNNSRWVEQIGESTQLTGSQIKSLYEDQPDTNAFTDKDESKLDSIEAGAEVNTVTRVAGKTGDVQINRNDVGLSKVDNESLLEYKNEQFEAIEVPNWEQSLNSQLNF